MLFFSKKISTFAKRKLKIQKMAITQEQRERYNETRRLKRRMASLHQKMEKMRNLQQMVEKQEYYNDSPEALEYYKHTYPTKAIDVWYDESHKYAFSNIRSASEFFGIHINTVRRLTNGTYSTTGKHTKDGYYFCPKDYREWLGKQTVVMPNLNEEIKMLSRYFSS